MKCSTTEEEEKLIALTAKHGKLMEVMDSLEKPSLLSFEWVKENILQIKDNEG